LRVKKNGKGTSKVRKTQVFEKPNCYKSDNVTFIYGKKHVIMVIDVIKEETADIQIRISKGTLEAIEKHGIYSDKSPEGILKRILPEYEDLKSTCSVVKKPEKEIPIESETKTEEKKEDQSKEEKPEEP